jgi:radical SAM superfamily enzyme YgiQ (UPF0313 family)
MKIQLIRPGFDIDKNRTIEDVIGLPQNLAILATKARGYADVIITDCNYKTLKESLNSIIVNEGDILGVTLLQANYSNGIKILEEGKNRGALTIAGGPQVQYVWKQMLNLYGFLDLVCIGKGEPFIEALAKDLPFEQIPNAGYRNNGKIVSNKLIPVKNNSFFDFENIDDKSIINLNIPYSMSLIDGCIKAVKSDVCSFCSIPKEFNPMPQNIFWEIALKLKKMYGFNSMFDGSPSILAGNYIQKLLNTRSNEMKDFIFKMFYTSPNQITEEKIKIFELLNTERIFNSVDSYNNEILKLNRKEYTTKDIDHATYLLDKSNILLMEPYMVGNYGETKKTLNDTVHYALSRMKNVFMMAVHITIPFIGTEIYEMLKNNGKARQEYNDIISNNPDFKKNYTGNLETEASIDTSILTRLHIKYNTKISVEDVIKARDYLDSQFQKRKSKNVVSFPTLYN